MDPLVVFGIVVLAVAAWILLWVVVGEIRGYIQDKRKMEVTNGRLDAVIADISRSSS